MCLQSAVAEVRHGVVSRTSWYASLLCSIIVAYGQFQRLYKIKSDTDLELLHELELEKDEDAPMSMAADLTVRQKFI